MKTADAAQGKWDFIFEHFGLPPITGKRHYKGACPICQRKNKFRIDDKAGRGTWICVCGAGSGFDLLKAVTGKDYFELASEVDLLIGNTNTRNDQEAAVRLSRHQTELDKFNAMIPLPGSDAHAYLRNRSIDVLPKHGVRFSLKEYHSGISQELPCMYALMTNDDMKIRYSHRTYIINGDKAKLENAREMRTIFQTEESVAVRLFPATSRLGVAEGIENALSAYQLYGVHTWATLNTSFLERFKAPSGVKELIIFADNDPHGAGLAAAFICGKKNILIKNDVERVYVSWPSIRNDFNDVLQDKSEEAIMKWTLRLKP